MKAVTVEQMKEIERKAIEEYGIPSMVLMENAGLNVVMAMEEEYGVLSGKRIFIFCGKGKNGGDGFVAARHLSNQGAQVVVYLLGARKGLAGDVKTQCEITARMGIEPVELNSQEDLAREEGLIATGDIFVDALLGTGQVGPVVDLMASLVVFINSLGIPSVAVDLPSGLQADTGRVEGACICASLTVTFGLPKIGLITYPGRDYAGKLVVADIGLPWVLLQNEKMLVELLDKQQIRNFLPVRSSTAHKGTMGHVLVVAGSMGMGGAAVLASRAALLTGAGLVTLATPASLVPCFESMIPEVVKKPLPETKDGALDLKSLDSILGLCENADAVAVGPGMGQGPGIRPLVLKLLEKIKKPLVLDADGLNALAGYANVAGVLKKSKASLVLTPHPGEMARLTKQGIKDIQNNRIERASRFCVETGTVGVLKGAGTVIAHPKGQVAINTTGNPGMATAGSGDVLTGMIAGLLAQGLSTWDGARAGVYLHGLAGDLASQKVGEASLTAGTLLEGIAPAFQSISMEAHVS